VGGLFFLTHHVGTTVSSSEGKQITSTNIFLKKHVPKSRARSRRQPASSNSRRHPHNDRLRPAATFLLRYHVGLSFLLRYHVGLPRTDSTCRPARCRHAGFTRRAAATCSYRLVSPMCAAATCAYRLVSFQFAVTSMKTINCTSICLIAWHAPRWK